MIRNDKAEGKNRPLQIDQANVFYNYTIGFDSTHIDLVKTAGRFLRTGISQAVFFSDLKCLYTDASAKVRLEWIRPQGRQWDSSWKIHFGPEVPACVVTELLHAMELSFAEQRIEGYEARQIPPYLRAFFPPIVLASDDLTMSIFASVKVFADGIAILSFQFKGTWNGIDEDYFISNVVNLYQRYFQSVWIDSRIQRLDAEELLPMAFQAELSIAGNPLGEWKTNRLLRKMRRDSRKVLNKDLDAPGRHFDIGNEEWILHQIAASKETDSWESSMDLCRSEYANALCGLIVAGGAQRNHRTRPDFMWEGRPSIAIMRFREQPTTKVDLLSHFGPSLSRILVRSAAIDATFDLPRDLRLFGDYCFHGNRGLLLWTWIRPEEAPDNVWDDQRTLSALMENQTRSEHIEYYNMRTVRACAWAQSPPSEVHMKEAYETLTFTDNAIYRSSQAGEISAALTYLMEESGTLKLVSAGKEAARWHLDELRYRSDMNRNRFDRCLAFVFGLVGTSGLADFAVRPYLQAAYPGLGIKTTPIVAFGAAGIIVTLVAFLVWFFSRMNSRN